MLLKRLLSLSSVRKLPRALPRASSAAPAIVADEEEDPNQIEPDVCGKMVFDNERERTVDPRVSKESKKPKQTVEQVIKATRAMRAKFIKKSATNDNFGGQSQSVLPEEKGEEDFFGLRVTQTESPLTKNISAKSEVKAERGSQYFDPNEPELAADNFDIDSLDKTVKLQKEYTPKVVKKKPITVKKETKNVADVEEASAKKPVYAFEVAMQIRRQLEGRADLKKDSKGFRTMVGATPNWDAITGQDMFSMIRKAIVYNADGIVAINKPYGLACQGGPGSKVSVASNFKLLSEWLKKIESQSKNEEKIGNEEELWCRLVHRLDRDTTGVLLIATKQSIAAKLRLWFNDRKVHKTYLAITKFVPRDSEGIIDIPMYESEVAIPAVEASRKQGAVRAVTKYKVIDSNSSSCALLELTPETGVKHQLRCHLGLGLATPILGDHKYSNVESVKPQRLPPSVLQAMDIRQAKVRSIPLHLHAARLVLPEFVDGRTIVISAKPPKFFIDTARRLKLKLPHYET